MGCSPSLPPAGVPEAEALALGLEDVAAVREAIEGGSREPLVTKPGRAIFNFCLLSRICG